MKKSGYRATSILPPGSTGADLQNAINLAAFGDVIQISGAMLFTDTVIIRDGLEVTIQSDAGNNWVMSQPNANIRHFEVNGSLILENITLGGGNSGGGVQLNQGSFAMLNGAVIQNCSAQLGGAVQVITGVFSIYGGTIQNNTAARGGGVYFASGMLNMSSLTGVIKNNTATDSGGGIYVESGVASSLSGGEISGNEAVNGGGLYLNSGQFTVSRGTFTNNKATSDGGGIYVSALGTLEISGSNASITNNVANNGNGGGIYTQDTTYSNITTSNSVVFRCNSAATAYNPPAAALYPNIQFASTTITTHPLNNFDINYINGEPIDGTYNVNYNSNGGVGSYTGPDIRPCTNDIILSQAQTGISRECYTFNGWNTRTDGSGTSYSPGAEVTLTNNMTLYAQWAVNLYSVDYRANGGSGSHSVANITCGTGHTVLSPGEALISRENYTFTGWNTQVNGSGTPYAIGDVITVNGNVVLYAQWEVNMHSVIYGANGGSGGHSVANIPHGTGHTVLSSGEALINRGGYTFTGWNTEPDGSGAPYTPGNVITITSDIILYAQWAANLYSVTYRANGGNGGHSITNISYGTEHTVLSPSEALVSRENYTFTGWNTQANGSGTPYAIGDVITITNDVILYAQWLANSYSVIYGANGGSGSHSDIGILHGAEYTVLSLAETLISRENYVFTGWNTQANGSGTLYVSGDVITITGNIILYAQWTANLHSVIYGANGGTGGYSDTDILSGTEYAVLPPGEVQISRVGYTFAGWNTEPGGSGTPYAPGDVITVAGNIILYAQWTVNLNSVTYRANGGSGGHSDINIPYGTRYTVLSPGEALISRVGYAFTGWNTEANGSGTPYNPGDEVTITGDIILYAQWAVRLYTVLYRANCGSGGYSDTNIPYGTEYVVLSPNEVGISREGYTFTGWNTRENGNGENYSQGDKITLTSNIILYAQWKSNKKVCCDTCCKICEKSCRNPLDEPSDD